MMVNNSTNIKKTNSSLSSQIIEHKKEGDICWWKCMSWLETSTQMWQG